MHKVPFITLAVSLLCLHVNKVESDTKYLSGIVRDQAPREMLRCGSAGTANNSNGFWYTDFQLDSPYNDNDVNLVGAECNSGNNFQSCGTINTADRTPVYNYPGVSLLGSVRSPESFYTWFHDSIYTKHVDYAIPLVQQNDGTYSHINNSFFIIDGMGWKDNCLGHNFAFCFEAHTRFGYHGDEIFNFAGDDDVWVYINDQLVIDLGGLHSQRSKSITLNTIPGLRIGENYRLDFFYCERHTDASTMQMTTSLEFYCAYYDLVRSM